MRITLCLLISAVLWGQSDRGTITGTVADPGGAVVANAPIEAKNLENGAIYQSATSDTGNYTLPQLPAGNYELTVTLPGFKKYTRTGLTVQVAQTIRIDIGLEVGSASESVTVTEAATLLKTESGELSHTVEGKKLEDLPILGTGAQNASTWGVRNTYSLTQLIPGTLFNSNTNIRVNGAVSNTQTVAIEGQDATDRFLPFSTVMTQPSADAVQEVAVQTSNFAAEFGQVGGGYFNITMKSGTNQYHGTAYNYYANEAFNASQPYTNLKEVTRRNNFGFALGGPLWIPKIYDGHNKTFFYYNLEYFRQDQVFNTTAQTIPTNLYRQGNFSQPLAAANRTIGTDPLGRAIPDNSIYDPLTERLAPNGALIRDQFPGNIIPAARLDPVALKIQALIPLPQTAGLINNIVPVYSGPTKTSFPSIKGDQQIGARWKASVYWTESSNIRPYSPGTGGAEGYPDTITAGRGNYIGSHAERINLEASLKPTLLLHLGAGYQHLDFQDKSPVTNYDSFKELGLRGQTLARNFPQMSGLNTASYGGMGNMGPNAQSISEMVKPTFNASLIYVTGNHTYKAGSELRFEGYPILSFQSAKGNYVFSANQTGQPSTQGQNLGGGATGFPYASFLLGLVNNGTIGNVTKSRGGKHQFGVYVQDTWKVTRKFTLDYGLRWDYSSYSKENYGRGPDFSATTPNPTVGGHLGSAIYEGDLPGRCKCTFASNYPYAVGPRVGLAYQITPKTVLRAGWGLVYTGTPVANLASNAVSSTPFSAPSPFASAMSLKDGVPLTPAQYAWPNFDPGQFPAGPSLIGVAPMNVIDQNAGRPARQNQWSIGLQREIFRNLVIDGSYVANRGVWWQANSLLNYNAISPSILAYYKLDPTNPNDQALLNSQIGSSTAIGRGFSGLPYPGFPANQPVSQALRPFPQFTTVSAISAPVGNTWYDSFQFKATKRLSYGIDFNYAFTFQKELVSGAESDSVGPGGIGASVNDVFNRGLSKYLSGQSRPFVNVISFSYRTPAKHDFAGNRVLGYVISDWLLNGTLTYSSGLPIQAPLANNALSSTLYQATFANRVPGQDLFAVDLNCHCFDPNTTFVLNPKAWTDPARGTFGTSAAYYNDYRQPRRPSENLNFGRTFKLVERVSLELRAEFSNITNRAYYQTPVSTNAAAPQLRNARGQTTGGFGWINTGVPLAATFAAPGPRSGQVVARFRF